MSMREFLLDTSVKSVRDLEMVLPYPVVGRIPHASHNDARKAAAQQHRAAMHAPTAKSR